MIPFVPRAEDTIERSSQDFAGAGCLLPVIGPTEMISGRVDFELSNSALAAKAGNLAARNALYLALQPKLLHLARRIRWWMLPQSWDRCDLEQESFIVFVQLLDDWLGEGSFSRYILSHFPWRLRNAARNARNCERPLAGRIEHAPLIEDDSWAAEEARILLENLATQFPPIDREILLGRVRDGDGFGALAHRLGLSRKTVYRHWTVIVLELRRSFGLPAEAPTGWYRYSRTWRTVPRKFCAPR